MSWPALKGKKLGIAITFYDRFDDLGGLHDIFRHNFQHPFHLYGCSHHSNPGPEMEKRGIRLDKFSAGEDIGYDPKDPIQMALICRVVNAIQTSCRLAIEDGCDYVMHVHCDAWPLKEDELLAMFSHLAEGDASVLLRADLGYLMDDNPMGTIDDHFFFFNAARMKTYRVFDFDPIDMLPHLLTAHGMLALQFVVKVPRREIVQYSDWQDTVRWPTGPKINGPFHPLKPSSFDEKRGFIHIHWPDFPDRMGLQLQSYYLQQQGLTKGPTVLRYLKDFVPSQTLLRDLNAWVAGKRRSWPLRIARWVYRQTFKKWTQRSSVRRWKERLGQIHPVPLTDYYRLHFPVRLFKERRAFWFDKTSRSSAKTDADAPANRSLSSKHL
jgi:hypothetical protein